VSLPFTPITEQTRLKKSPQGLHQRPPQELIQAPYLIRFYYLTYHQVDGGSISINWRQTVIIMGLPSSTPRAESAEDGNVSFPDQGTAVFEEPEYFALTEECHHYTRRQDVNWDIQK
jgi:hypothetical protein